MGVVKQKPFMTSTRYTLSITDIQYKTCVVCKISLFIILLFLYIILCVFIIYLLFIIYYLLFMNQDIPVSSTAKAVIFTG